jgi:hypothetical protein
LGHGDEPDGSDCATEQQERRHRGTVGERRPAHRREKRGRCRNGDSHDGRERRNHANIGFRDNHEFGGARSNGRAGHLANLDQRDHDPAKRSSGEGKYCSVDAASQLV